MLRAACMTGKTQNQLLPVLTSKKLEIIAPFGIKLN
jgi:hypothetical protein